MQSKEGEQEEDKDMTALGGHGDALSFLSGEVEKVSELLHREFNMISPSSICLCGLLLG